MHTDFPSGIRIEYAVHGAPDAPALVLITGLGLQMTAWPTSFIEGLAARGFRVVSFDNRDAGLSSRATSAKRIDLRAAAFKGIMGFPVQPPYTLEDMGSDAIGLMNVLKIDRAHVLGISMGGIVGRFLASERGLRVARLFTLASPHRGAKITRRIRPDAGAVQLAPGSPLLTHLDATLEGSLGELTCYSLLRDWMVGATNTSPPGHPSLWLDTDRWLAHPLSHFSITSDLRIVGDLALRLTGQSPWSTPGAPPPRD